MTIKRRNDLAARKARTDSYIYRFGGGWVVSTWCRKMQMWHVSESMTFKAAQTNMRDWRETRELQFRNEEVVNV